MIPQILIYHNWIEIFKQAQTEHHKMSNHLKATLALQTLNSTQDKLIRHQTLIISFWKALEIHQMREALILLLRIFHFLELLASQ